MENLPTYTEYLNESLSNVNKFMSAYLKYSEIESTYNNRNFDDKYISTVDMKSMKSEYKKIAKRMEQLASKISEDEFNKHIEPTLIMSYEEFQEEWESTLS